MSELFFPLALMFGRDKMDADCESKILQNFHFWSVDEQVELFNFFCDPSWRLELDNPPVITGKLLLQSTKRVPSYGALFFSIMAIFPYN